MGSHVLPRALVASVLLIVLANASRSLQAQEKYIASGDEWKYFKGTEDAPVDWPQLGFDDSSWLMGATPIGYSTDLQYKTVLDDMMGAEGYLTVYTRKTFNVADASAVKLLKMVINYDDGFVAYLNGSEIVRKSMPPGAVTKDTGGLDHEGITPETVYLSCDALIDLKTGENVLAIEGHNSNTDSSDFTLNVTLESLAGDLCPTDLTCTLNASGTVTLKWKKPVGVAYDTLALFRNDVQITPGPAKTVASYVDRAPAQGVNNYRLATSTCGGADCPEITCSLTIGGGGTTFRRGDSDDNGAVNITDPVKLLGSLFRGEPAPTCPDAADFDDNGALNITDAVYLLTALFRGGPAPPPPGSSDCGEDPTQDDLGDCTSTSCQ
jgi:hypothetical protein